MKYLLIITMVIMSGSALGWIIPGSGTIQAMISIMALIFNLIRKKTCKVQKKNFYILIISIVCLSLNIVITSGVQTVILYYNMFLLLFSVYVISEIMTFEDFSEKFVNIFVFLTITSLLFWGLAQIDISVGDISVLAANGKYYRLNLLYVYKEGDTYASIINNSKRNFGIFWEPGAYQGYLNLALMFLLFSVSRKKDVTRESKYKFKVLTLVLGVLSTQSTAGYFVLLLIFIAYYFRNVDKNKINIKTVLAAVMLMLVSFIMLNSDTIQMKFNENSSTYTSTLIRLNDNLNGIKAVFNSPIIGLGFNSARYEQVMADYGIFANSSGLLMTLQQFGVFLGTLILVRIFLNLSSNLTLQGLSKVIYVLMMFVLMSCEAFVTKEIFTIFLFSFNEKLHNNMLSSFSINKVQR